MGRRVFFFAWAVMLAALGTGIAPGTAWAQDADGASPGRVPASWTSDRQDLVVGDILTVVVDEQTLASVDQANSQADLRDRDLAFGLGSTSTRIRADSDAGRSQRGQADRRDQIATDITARVVELGPAGVVRIEGTKTVRVDEHEQTIVIRGWIRPEDVSFANQVSSWRISDLELLLESNGELTASGSFLDRILDFLFP